MAAAISWRTHVLRDVSFSAAIFAHASASDGGIKITI
jgi:hypothetical protein